MEELQQKIDALRTELKTKVDNDTMEIINTLIDLEIELEQECNQ